MAHNLFILMFLYVVFKGQQKQFLKYLVLPPRTFKNNGKYRYRTECFVLGLLKQFYRIFKERLIKSLNVPQSYLRLHHSIQCIKQDCGIGFNSAVNLTLEPKKKHTTGWILSDMETGAGNSDLFASMQTNFKHL